MTVELVLSQRHYDVIHFNNGMHGWGYSESEYGAAIGPMLATLRRLAPHATLIWATTTPTAGGAAERNPRIDERNRLVREALAPQSITVDDLHAVIAADPAQISKDGVHMSPQGSLALATQVATSIRTALAKTGEKPKQP
jgi:lysophospholipase L1-like esterase